MYQRRSSPYNKTREHNSIPYVINPKNVNQIYHRFDVKLSYNLLARVDLIYKLLSISYGHTDLSVYQVAINHGTFVISIQRCTILLHSWLKLDTKKGNANFCYKKCGIYFHY